MNKTVEQIKDKFEENPLEVMTAAATIASVVVPVGMLIVGWKNSRTWRREVNRRVKNSK